MAKIRLDNDYTRTAHYKVINKIQSNLDFDFPGYGEDKCCKEATNIIRSLIKKPDASVYFLTGATQANLIIISAALSPVQSVICADTGHIFCHEAASAEHTGHKVQALPSSDGKITAEQIEEIAESYYKSPKDYLTEPKLVYISFPTELGTLYSRSELEAISSICKRYNMYLFVDGARLGYGIGSSENDVEIQDIGSLTDAFVIGGTKCGAMFGEAIVLTNPALKNNFKTYMRQNGALLAKGWLMGLQFIALLEDGTYWEICKKADEEATRLRGAFRGKGIPEYVVSPTNQQFIILTNEQAKALSEKTVFREEKQIDDNHKCVRFCTSWSTTDHDIDLVIEAINDLK